MRKTSGISERLTDLRRVGQSPPQELLTLDGTRYMTPQDAWHQLRSDARGFVLLQSAVRLLDRPESQVVHQRVTREALARLAGRAALWMAWHRANPGVGIASWDPATQRVLEACAELQGSGHVPVTLRDALRTLSAMHTDERERMPMIAPAAWQALSDRELRMADLAEGLVRHAGGAGLTTRMSEQVQALARPFAFWQTPVELAADLIARIVLGRGQSEAVTVVGRKRALERIGRGTPSSAEAPQPTRERLPADRREVPSRDTQTRPVDPVDPVIRWTIRQGGVHPGEFLDVDGYTLQRLLGFRGLVSQEGTTFETLGQRWAAEHREEPSHPGLPGEFFRELFFFMLAESAPSPELQTGVHLVDPVVMGTLLRGGLRPDQMVALSTEEQDKVGRIPGLVSIRGRTWLEHARAHYNDPDVQEHFTGTRFDVPTMDDFIELFRYGLDYTEVEPVERLPVFRKPVFRKPVFRKSVFPKHDHVGTCQRL